MNALQDLPVPVYQSLLRIVRQVQIIGPDIDVEIVRLKVIDADIHVFQQLKGRYAADSPVVNGIGQLLIQQQLIDRELLHQA